MTDEYQVVIGADPHLGANLWGTSYEKWAEPAWELLEYCAESDVRQLIIAGDVMHHRNPTTEAHELWQDYVFAAAYRDIELLVIPGNHDLKVAPGSVEATVAGNGHFTLANPGLSSFERLRNGLGVLCLPWPILNNLPMTQGGLRQDLEAAAVMVLERLYDAMNGVNTDRAPSILVGHAHVYYGGERDGLAPRGPGLMAGRDVLLPYEALMTIPGITDVWLGHIHQPMLCYAGSTQPTDMADDGTKSFVHLTVKRAGDEWVSSAMRVPYKSSLKVRDVAVEYTAGDDLGDAIARSFPSRYDVGRLTIRCMSADTHVSPEILRIINQDLAAMNGKVLGGGAVVQPFRDVKRRAQAVETITDTRGEERVPDLSQIPDAVAVWAETKSIGGERQRALLEEVEGILSDG